MWFEGSINNNDKKNSDCMDHHQSLVFSSASNRDFCVLKEWKVLLRLRRTETDRSISRSVMGSSFILILNNLPGRSLMSKPMTNPNAPMRIHTKYYYQVRGATLIAYPPY